MIQNWSTYLGHIFLGFTVATVFQFSLLAMVLSVQIIGIGKELFDKYHGGIFDWLDLFCTELGGFAGYWIVIAYK